MCTTYPNYLAYFNRIAGGPANGYKHLVDSSLDWGQDLPGLKRWLKEHDLDSPGKTPVYLAYFGQANPAHYHIRAMELCSPDSHSVIPLSAGVYCISHCSPARLWAGPATVVSGVRASLPRGWSVH